MTFSLFETDQKFVRTLCTGGQHNGRRRHHDSRQIDFTTLLSVALLASCAPSLTVQLPADLVGCCCCSCRSDVICDL